MLLCVSGVAAAAAEIQKFYGNKIGAENKATGEFCGWNLNIMCGVHNILSKRTEIYCEKKMCEKTNFSDFRKNERAQITFALLLLDGFIEIANVI